MMRRKREILLSVVAVGLFCLAGCAGTAPAESTAQELDAWALAEGITEESGLLALAESVTDESDLLPLAGNITEEPDPAALVRRRVQLLERVLGRLDRTIERGQLAEENRAQILERV